MPQSENRVPLLTPEADELATNGVKYELVEEVDNATPSRTGPEARRILALAVPISLSEVLSFFGYLITTAQVGRLDDKNALAALFMARSVFHITGLSLVVGVASAVETFCGQAFGARQYRVLGLVLQRAILLCLLTCVLPLALWTRPDWLLRVIGQNIEVIPQAAVYLKLMGPVLILWAVSCCIQAYFSSQGEVAPLTAIALTSTLLTPLVNYLLIFRLGWGMRGAAIAYNVMHTIEVGLLVAAMAYLHFVRQRPDTRTWSGFSSQALKGWGKYMKVALPSAAAICMDWWTYEAVILIAGLLHDASVQQAAMGLAFNTHALLFMVVQGFSSAASTRVSNELGAGRGHCARFAAWLSVVIGFVAPLAASAALLAAPRAWARIYTTDQPVIDLVARLMPVLTISNLADSVAAVISGVLRGSGRQELAFKVNLAVFWVLGLPAASLLALRFHQGAMGMWLAMGVASGLQAIILVGQVLRFDWTEEARKARERVAATHGSSDWRAVGGHAALPEEPTAAGQHVDAAERGVVVGGAAGQEPGGPSEGVEGPAAPLHAGVGSRHGVYEPLLGSEHIL